MEHYTQNGGGGFAYPVQLLLQSTDIQNSGIMTGGGSEKREYKSYENLGIPIGLVHEYNSNLKSWKRATESIGWLDDTTFDSLFSLISESKIKSNNKSKKKHDSKSRVTKKNN